MVPDREGAAPDSPWPNSGRIAVRHLRQQGFSTFLPVEAKTLRRKGRFRTELRPLFPGYLFVAFDPGHGPWRAINSTQGVARLVSFGRAPEPVPLDIVAQLMARCDADSRLLPPPRFAPGDKVRLADGPLSEFVATIEEIAPDRRAWVLMELMGGSARVAVDTDELRIV